MSIRSGSYSRHAKQWKIRLQEAKSAMDSMSAGWSENVKLYNGKKKFKGNVAYKYYIPAVYQKLKIRRAQAIPASLDFVASVVGENDPNTNALVTALLNSQLQTEEFMEILNKTDTQIFCKGYGWIQADIEYITNEDGEVIVERIKPVFHRTEDVLYDPNARLFSDIHWIAAAYWITVEEFLADDGLLDDAVYKKKDKILKAHNIKRTDDDGVGWIEPVNVVPTHTKRSLGSKENSDENLSADPRFYRLKIWEIWDAALRQKIHMEDMTLAICLEEDYQIKSQHFKFPMVPLSYTDEDDEELPPHPEIDNWIDFQKQKIRLRQNQLEDATKRVRAFLALPDAFNKEELTKAIAGSPKNRVVFANGEAFGAMDTNRDISRLIMPLPENSSPPDTEYISRAIDADFDQTSGMGPAGRGGLPVASSATETNAMMGMMGASAQKIGMKVINAAKRFAEMSLIMMAELFEEETVVQMYEIGRPAAWSTLKKRILKKGRFAVEVYPGIKGVIDRQSMSMEILNTIKTIFPFAQANNLDLTPMVKRLMFLQGMKPSEIESVFSGRTELAKAVLTEIMQSLQDGNVDQNEMQVILGKATMLAKATLGPADIAELQGKFKGSGGQAPGPQSAAGAGSQRTETPELAQQDMGRGPGGM